jgi:carbamate kinase
MLVVIALGGKALLDPAEGFEAVAHQAGARAAVAAIAEVARHHQVVLTHGSAPQVGLLAYQSALSRHTTDFPLDIVEAEAEGFLGYLLQQELANELRDREVATLLTQVQVDPGGPSFNRDRKLVGPVIAPVDAEGLQRERGWVMEPVKGGFRRSVPCPEPLAVVELRTIQRLVSAGVVVICAGGGGIPVACDANGALAGVEAVIDKDRSAALLASLLGADLLLYLTDVPSVVKEWGSAFMHPITKTTPAALRNHGFDPATMGSKVESACRFVDRTGKRAAIGAVPDAVALTAGEAGTQILPDKPGHALQADGTAGRRMSAAAVKATTAPSATSDQTPSNSVQFPMSSVAAGRPVVRERT